MSAADGAREADRAMEILRGAAAEGVHVVFLRVEPSLDPLRGRADFRLLQMDASFPDDPFTSDR